MMSRFLVAGVTTCLLVISNSSGAQATSGDVTFKLPLNLTQLSSDIAKVMVSCAISSDAIPQVPNPPRGRDGTPMAPTLGKQEEFPVSGGQLVTTAIVVVPVSGLDNPIGKTANYNCSITGYSSSLQQWSYFEEGHATPAFRLTPTPPRMTGSFVW